MDHAILSLLLGRANESSARSGGDLDHGRPSSKDLGSSCEAQPWWPQQMPNLTARSLLG